MYPELPDDLLLAVFAFLGRVDLASVCRVSKRCRCLAAEHLYRDVRITGIVSSCSPLRNLLVTLATGGEYPAVWVCVIHLDMYADAGRTIHISVDTPALLTVACSSLCNLHTLSLGETFDPFLASSLSCVRLPNLRKLLLHNAAGLEQFFVRHAPTLTHVIVHGMRLNSAVVAPNLQHIESNLVTASLLCMASCQLHTVYSSLCEWHPSGHSTVYTSIVKEAFALFSRSVRRSVPYIAC